MSVATGQGIVVRFAEFELDLQSGELRTNGTSLKLQPQPAKILALLVRRRGETVTRDEIIEEVWGSDTFVDYEGGLNFAIRQIRSTLGDDAERPLYVETVPKRGYRFVGPVVAAVPPISGTRPYGRILWISVLSCAVVLGSLFALNIDGIQERLKPNGRPRRLSSNAPVKIRRSVAVVGFKNLSGRSDAAWLSTALADMLTTELAAGEQLRTVSAENIARAKSDLSLSDTDSYAPDTLLRLRQNLGADLIVTGSYSDLGGGTAETLRVDLRIQDAASGETKILVSETGTARELFQLVAHSGSDLRQKLGLSEIGAIDLASVQASYPSRIEAARWYAEGAEKLRVNDALGARALLEKATSVDPSYPLAHSALAIAWSVLGYDVKAGDEGKTAFDLSGNLTREERLLVEARYREVTKQWALAIPIYRTLFNFYPDNPAYGLSLVRAQGLGGKSKESSDIILQLRNSGAIAPDDPRLIMAEASTEAILGNLPLAIQTASDAAVKARAQGARFQFARARALEGSLRWRTGDGKKAIELLNEAKEIYTAVGNRSGEAQTLHDIGTTLFFLGDMAGAQTTLEQAASIRREIGEKYGLSRSVNNRETSTRCKEIWRVQRKCSRKPFVFRARFPTRIRWQHRWIILAA